MFGWGKTLDVITLFHKPSLQSSTRLLALLQRASIKASDPGQKANIRRTEWDLEVTEKSPTSDQLRSILEYVGAGRAGDIMRGAKDEADAMRRLKAKPGDFVWPLTVDWSNGRVVTGEDTSEILKLLEWNGK